MSESPTVDEFIRHMQAELDACDDIVDKMKDKNANGKSNLHYYLLSNSPPDSRNFPN